ncbi:calpain-A-like [Aphidius gifuensis]|uniref:calpain-A-like n=1 Tax=Aphidius gifuensis TaxID=684658 RepID=UPI001CDC2423|nr:calpain-A-like [Aphidius gifuensis]
MRDDPPTRFQRFSSDENLREITLTEYVNDEIIEFQQQDFHDLQRNLLEKKDQFEDDQFSEELFELSKEKILKRPKAGTWVDVVIDDRLPTENGKLVYASSGYENEFWPALIEKAYAKLLYRSYEKLSEGNFRISMQDLSGGIGEEYLTESSSEKLFEIIQDAKIRPTLIACGTSFKVTPEMSEFGLMQRHQYAITDVKLVKKKNVDDESKLIRIRNPHGKKIKVSHFGKIPDSFEKEIIKSKLKIEVDGEIWILYEDFIKLFEFVEICNLTPNRIINNIYAKKEGKKLSLSAIEGKWMGGINSREASVDVISKIYPKYSIVLTKPDYEDEKCNILIGLSIERRQDLEEIDGDEIIDAQKSFDSDDTEFDPVGGFGQAAKRLYLKLGTYYIIPYTTDTFKGATFYLQILSEHKNILKVHDRDIDINQIMSKLHTLTPADDNENLDDQLFLNMASKVDGKIDFKSYILHELVDEVFLELETILETKKFVSKKKLSIARIAKVTLTVEEAFERYEEAGSPGSMSVLFLTQVLERNGYLKNEEVIETVHEEMGMELIHVNDIILIVVALKSRFGLPCEEFNANLCQDFIAMVRGYDDFQGNYLNFNEPTIHDLRIDTKQFEKITQFITESKKQFDNYATESYFSVQFKQLKNTLDAIDYKLRYSMIANIFQKYGNELDIFYDQFIQSVVDTTLILGTKKKTE